MGLKAIHGGLLDSQNFTATFGSNVIEEELLIEMDSPLERQNDVVTSLPIFGQNSFWTFSIGISRHPYRTDLILKSCNGVRQAPEGRPFWIVSVTYETPRWDTPTNRGEDIGRGNVERKKRINETDPNNPKPIKAPWEEPPTWSSATRMVRITKFHDSDGILLRHANGLPVTDGIDVEIMLEAHSFTWNVPWQGFSYATKVRPYLNKLNNDTVFGKGMGYVYLENCTCTENYRESTTPAVDGQAGGTDPYHFATLNATFIIDPRNLANNAPTYFVESYRRVSMHTMQKLVFAGKEVFVPIVINSRGDYAEAPWPLLSETKANAIGKQFGEAVPYDIMSTVNPLDDFYFIDPGYPEFGDLKKFANDNNLVIK